MRTLPFQQMSITVPSRDRQSSSKDAPPSVGRPRFNAGLADLHGKVWVARYSNLQIAHRRLTAVRITRFFPRFLRLPFKLHGPMLEFAPSADLLKGAKEKRITPAQFDAGMEAQMNALDLADVARKLRGLVEGSELGPEGGPARLGIVLCCFEDVRKGLRCHRTQVGDWLNYVYGLDVKELPEE
jgi:hypothetical protein